MRVVFEYIQNPAAEKRFCARCGRMSVLDLLLAITLDCAFQQMLHVFMTNSLINLFALALPASAAAARRARAAASGCASVTELDGEGTAQLN